MPASRRCVDSSAHAVAMGVNGWGRTDSHAVRSSQAPRRPTALLLHRRLPRVRPQRRHHRLRAARHEHRGPALVTASQVARRRTARVACACTMMP